MSFSFGTNPTFGAPTNTFGAPASTFGAPTNTFGTPTSTFGAPTSTFGTPTNTFGTPTNTFGTPANTFGAPTNTFGTPANTFGTPTSTFGTPQANFGSATVSQPSLFATPATQQGLSFGAPVPSTQNASLFAADKTGGLKFGLPTFTSATSTGNSLAVPAGSGVPGLSFAPNVTIKPPENFNSFAKPPATTAGPGFGFGLSGPTSIGLSMNTTPSLGINFAGSCAPSSIGGPSLNSGIGFGTLPTATSIGLSFGALPSTPVTTPAPIGLGGIATSTPTSSATAAKTEQAPKEQHLPNEIQQTVDGFKNFVKEQKAYSSDVARSSAKEFNKVEADINATCDLLNEVEKQLEMNRKIAEKLKYDTAKGLQEVEMAQRTYDTPLGLQYENNAPTLFFLELVNSFEREMQNLKLQIENTDKYVRNIGKPTSLNSQDLSLGLRRIHETFVALAGRLQAVHTQVETQKEQYLKFRKNVLNDSTNIFERQTKESDALNIALNSIRFEAPKIATGPTPFSAVSHPSVVQAAVQGAPPPPYQPTSTFGGFSSGLAGGSNLFGSTNFGTQTFNSPSASSSFQLQKPPVGIKRGKQ